MHAFRSPLDKVECIARCCRAILSLIKISGRTGGIDDVLPVLTYVILHANPPHLFSTMNYIKYFGEARLKSETEYWWYQFLQAFNHIKTLTETPQKMPAR